MSALQDLTSSKQPYLGDGGIETDLIFNHGAELPYFSSFVLLSSAEGRNLMEAYFEDYFRLAEMTGRGFVIDTATWRANSGWADRHVLTLEEVKKINRDAVRFARYLRDQRPRKDKLVINGVVGPLGDGYAPEQRFTPREAAELHLPQMEVFAEENVDLASAMTMTHPGEAIGVVRAAQAVGVPVVISFTVETDGKLPTGQDLGSAIEEVEQATSGAPLFYRINCAHPTHLKDKLSGAWTGRIGLVRANASYKSHAELDEATELDAGDPADFGHQHVELFEMLPNLKIAGGCCGTDYRHAGEIARNI